MAQILDCLVSYFGLNEREEPDVRRYYCYHVFGGAGPTADSGVAIITTLAVCEDGNHCVFCPRIHVVDSGGPAAAIAKAIHLLDAYLADVHVQKVQSEIRGTCENLPVAYAFLSSAVRPLEAVPR
jgi:hypothetical protein